MDNRIKNLKILGIFNFEQLQNNSLNYWWQKKYKEVQNNQEWLIEINNAKDELEKYDSEKLQTLLPKQTKNTTRINKVQETRKEGKKLNKFSVPINYERIQKEMKLRVLSQNPYHCFHCGGIGKDIWSEPWIKKNGNYDFSEFKDCPMCLDLQINYDRRKKNLLKLSS